jgi:hypothetical protein
MAFSVSTAAITGGDPVARSFQEIGEGERFVVGQFDRGPA